MEVGGCEATSVGGYTCGTRRSKRSMESELEQGSLWLGWVMGRSWLGPQGSVMSLGDRVCVWACWKTPPSRGRQQSQGAGGVVGNYHFAGVVTTTLFSARSSSWWDSV